MGFLGEAIIFDTYLLNPAPPLENLHGIQKGKEELLNDANGVVKNVLEARTVDMQEEYVQASTITIINEVRWIEEELCRH